MTAEVSKKSMMSFWLLGGWLFLSISMAYTAGSTFSTLKPNSLRRANEVFSKLDAETERPFALRYVASELNRRFFLHYGCAQLILGLAALVLMLGQRQRLPLITTVLAFVLALVFRFYLIPEAVELGRAIDFTAKDILTNDRVRFNNLHRASTTIEGIKMVLLLAATYFLARSKPISSK